jgi:hypothetical protein
MPCVPLVLLAALTPLVSSQPRPVVRLFGADFAGGAGDLFGRVQQGAARVNYVYAQPTGERSTMAGRFTLSRLPDGPLFLHVRGRLDDHATPCPIRLALNGTTLLEGANAFAHEWEWKRLPIPPGLLREGDNEVTAANLSAEGILGMPPWFMLAVCAVGEEDCVPSASPGIEEDFVVRLPAGKRPLPESLPPGRAPGFRLRGTKGWLWRPEQYLAEIPVLPRYKLNFLMNCYGSMCDIEHFPWGHPQCNRWWEPLPEAKRQAYEAIVRRCRECAVQFCFSLNPNIASTRIVRYDSDEDFALLWQHYAWMQGLKVQWFNLQFDDITAGIDAAGQARLANRLFARLRECDPHAQLILCPTYYWGTGQDPTAREYLQTWARELHPDVFVFWTGDAVVTPRITRAAAESFRQAVGHRLITWDNYPVNDGAPTLHLGPVIGRDPGLADVCDGYMSNPMHTQNETNRLPLLTTADFAYNPWAYDPERSIGQAILHLAGTPEEQATLADLVELYPGMLIFGQGTGYNPFLTRFEELLATPHSHPMAAACLEHAEGVLHRLQTQFGDRFTDAQATLAADLARARMNYEAAYGIPLERPQ